MDQDFLLPSSSDCLVLPFSQAPEEEEEEDEILEETDEEKALPSSLRKSLVAAKREQRKAQKGKGGTMKAQKDINVKDELELPYRQELYRGFLLYCLSGDVVTLPLGAQIVIDRDESEFVRLAQLGDILGLTPADVSGVHKGLAEQVGVKRRVTQLSFRLLFLLSVDHRSCLVERQASTLVCQSFVLVPFRADAVRVLCPNLVSKRSFRFDCGPREGLGLRPRV